jgi:hypothetical protein
MAPRVRRFREAVAQKDARVRRISGFGDDEVDTVGVDGSLAYGHVRSIADSAGNGGCGVLGDSQFVETFSKATVEPTFARYSDYVHVTEYPVDDHALPHDAESHGVPASDAGLEGPDVLLEGMGVNPPNGPLAENTFTESHEPFHDESGATSRWAGVQREPSVTGSQIDIV